MINQYPDLLYPLLTGDATKGKQRLRVDPGQTGFFEGREFRTFVEFSIASGVTFVVKVVSPINFILSSQTLNVDDGYLRFSAVAGDGTPGGTFSTTHPIIGKNRMTERPSPNYTAQITVSSGGTHTGGTEVEVTRIKAANATSQATTIISSSDEARGLAAGTYYLRFQNIGTGTAAGVYAIWWEERP